MPPHVKLTEGPLRHHLVTLTLPMVWGVLASMTFNLADTFFVGQLGTDPLAAISFTFPVVTTIISIALGLGIATSSVLSRAIGGAMHRRVMRLATDSFMLSFLVAIGVTILGLMTIDPLFRLLGAEPRLLPLIGAYMTVWYEGAVFAVILSMVANNALRSSGDTLTPSMIMIGAAIINAGLDPLLIFGLGPIPMLGLKGAAYATVISRGLSFLALAAVLHFRLHLIDFARPSIRAVMASWKALSHVAVPASVTNIITPVSIAIITALVAPFGVAAVAGFGVASRVQMFALVPILALTASQGPLVGQNWGAGKVRRVDKAVRLSCAFSLAWGFAVAVLLAFTGSAIARLFNADATVVATARAYLRIVPISYGAYGVIICTNAAFNAMGKPIFASALNLSRTLVFYVPLAYAGASWFGLYGVFGAAPLASFIVGVAAWLWNRRICRKRPEMAERQAANA